MTAFYVKVNSELSDTKSGNFIFTTYRTKFMEESIIPSSLFSSVKLSCEKLLIFAIVWCLKIELFNIAW